MKLGTRKKRPGGKHTPPKREEGRLGEDAAKVDDDGGEGIVVPVIEERVDDVVVCFGELREGQEVSCHALGSGCKGGGKRQ